MNPTSAKLMESAADGALQAHMPRVSPSPCLASNLSVIGDAPWATSRAQVDLSGFGVPACSPGVRDEP